MQALQLYQVVLGPLSPKPKDHNELLRRRAASARYLLHADVQNFYPSIYTHSIDWAMHGKVAAKTAHKAGKVTFGARLDKAFQTSQDGQTSGICIGPDTSLIVAECIMARVEEGIRTRLPNVRGYRFWDDFELSFSSLQGVEEGLTVLQEEAERIRAISEPAQDPNR